MLPDGSVVVGPLEATCLPSSLAGTHPLVVVRCALCDAVVYQVSAYSPLLSALAPDVTEQPAQRTSVKFGEVVAVDAEPRAAFLFGVAEPGASLAPRLLDLLVLAALV